MNKFEKAYDLIKDNIGCPKGCIICENGWMQFLPNEIEFLSKNFNIKKEKLALPYKIGRNIVWMRLVKDKHCPFYKFKKCINREARPLDCRSFPAIPYLNNKNNLQIKLSQKCPLVRQNKINKKFIQKALLAWKIVNPPKWWLKRYTEYHKNQI